MAIADITLVRKRIGDNAKSYTESFHLTPTTTTVQTSYNNITILNVYDRTKSTQPLVLDTDYSLDAIAGAITLQYTPEDEAVLSVVYTYVAFTDDELNTLIADYGVLGACVEAIRWIIADSARLHDYTRGETTEKLSDITNNLRKMLADYEAQAANEVSSTTNNDLVITKRHNDFNKRPPQVPFDLSRDDSLSL